MNMKDFFQLLAALAVSLGGTTVVVVALAKWFGGFISTRLLDSYNNKHERELEKIKSGGLSDAPVSKRGTLRIRQRPWHARGHMARQDSNPSARSFLLSTTL